MAKEKVKEDAVLTPEPNEIIVRDPEVARPVELPLVVEPSNGKWANEAQEKFAQTLNAYAYINPKKWAIKKDALIKQLAELEKNPEKLSVLEGGQAPSVKVGKNILGS